MRTKDIYLLIHWDAYENDMYQIEQAFLSKSLLIKYLDRHYYFDDKKEIVNFIDSYDVYQIGECENAYAEKISFTYDEKQQPAKQDIYVLLEDFDDYCDSLKAFSTAELCKNYLSRKFGKNADKLMTSGKYKQYRVKQGYLYK